MNDMSRRIVFLRHGKVDLPFASHDDMPFEILRDLGAQVLDPPSDMVYLESVADHLRSVLKQFQFGTVLRSPSQRCSTLERYLQSIAQQQIPPASELSSLQEIWFDLNILFPNHNATVKDIAPKLINALLEGGQGVEPVTQVLGRFDSLMSALPQSGDVLVLTHGFFMRLLASAQVSSAGRGEPTRSAWELAPRFGYLEGFVLESDLPLQYITTD
jgi:broad specificity phosphatase PhoE